MLILHLLTFN